MKNQLNSRHIEAKVGEISPYVLICGSPQRVTHAAKKFLKDYKLVAQNRGALIYTGSYNGFNISIATSGMGTPSIGIYSFELFDTYNVQALIRVGTAGGISPDANVFDIYNVDKAYNIIGLGFPSTNRKNTAECSPEVFATINEIAKKTKLPIKQCKVLTHEIFYSDFNDLKKAHIEEGCDLVEMESKMLFDVANHFKRKSGTILYVSDLVIYKNEKKLKNKVLETTFKERVSGLDKAFILALDSLVELGKNNNKS